MVNRWTATLTASLAVLLFTVQDAGIKYLLTTLSIWQVLSVRSFIILAGCLVACGPSLAGQACKAPLRWPLLARSGTSLAAWWLFFEAAKTLPMGQLTTLYLVAPLIAAALSAAFLRERLRLQEGIALGVGALGTVAAAGEFDLAVLLAPAMVLTAAVLWAFSLVLLRWIGQRETPPVQLVFNNAVFLLGSMFLGLRDWHVLSGMQWLEMVGIGVLSGGGQILLILSARVMPVAGLAALQYTGLLWAFLLGYLVWNAVPSLEMVLGAVLVGLGGIVLLIRHDSRITRKRQSPWPAVVIQALRRFGCRLWLPSISRWRAGAR